MLLEAAIRRGLRRRLAGTDALRLEPGAPDLARALEGVDELGLYLHVPFCRRICPYCPYNKTLLRAELAARYVDAVRREIDRRAPLGAGRRTTSVYVGGGTPTTLVGRGLGDLLAHLLDAFDVRDGVHLEAHPTDLDAPTIDALRAMRVEHLSLGVESLDDRLLRTLGRPYSAEVAREAVRRAVGAGFRCVNADMMFALPGQSVDDAVATARGLLDLGVDQVAAYPLFDFPHAGGVPGARRGPPGPRDLWRRRRTLRAIERVMDDAGFRRTSVWAFTRPGVPAYCSVTVPLYLGLGASGGSYLRDLFCLNTFDVRAYVEAMEQARSPIALSIRLDPRMQMAGWLYWRIYATRFRRSEFRARFGLDYDAVYGRPTRLGRACGLLRDDGESLALTPAGAFWLHVVQDLFSIDGVGRLWSIGMREPWPTAVSL